MAYSSIASPFMALRSEDTLETLSQCQQRYSLLSNGDPEFSTVIHPCVNMQKKATGLSGLMTQIPGECLLSSLDMLTEEVFRGISVVKCNVSESDAISLLKRKTELNTNLASYMLAQHQENKEKGIMFLDQVAFCKIFWSCQFVSCKLIKSVRFTPLWRFFMHILAESTRL